MLTCKDFVDVTSSLLLYGASYVNSASESTVNLKSFCYEMR